MLYEDFWACGGDWKRSTILRSITNSFENKKTGKRRWLTKKQMLPYFDNDEEIVDGVILRKKSDPELCKLEIRVHPEVGTLYQYLVLVEDEEEATESDKILDRFQLKDTGHDSEDSDDDDESDDDDDCDDKKPRKSAKKKGNKETAGKTKKPKAWPQIICKFGHIVGTQSTIMLKFISW